MLCTLCVCVWGDTITSWNFSIFLHCSDSRLLLGNREMRSHSADDFDCVAAAAEHLETLRFCCYSNIKITVKFNDYVLQVEEHIWRCSDVEVTSLLSRVFLVQSLLHNTTFHKRHAYLKYYFLKLSTTFLHSVMIWPKSVRFFLPCLLIKTIPKTAFNLWTSFKSGSLCIG